MGSESRQIMDHIRRIVQALRSSHRAAGHLNLTGAQLFVLKVIADAGRSLSVKEVAERTQTDQSTVSVVVSRLVDRGLITRKQSAEDTRRAELSLTARGRAVQKKAPATIGQQRLAASVNNLKPRDARMLLKYLDAIVKEMQIADAPAAMMFSEETEGAARRPPSAKKRRQRSPLGTARRDSRARRT